MDGQQSYQSYAVPLISQPPATAFRTVDMGLAKKIFILGIIQIVIGILMLGFGIGIFSALKIESDSVNANGSSIWIPIWIIVTGILGICIHYHPQSRCLIGTFNGFVITSSILALGIVAVSAVALKVYSNCKLYGNTYPNWDTGRRIELYATYWSNKICRDHRKFALAAYSLLLIFGLVEIALAITSAVFSFKIFNCCSQGCNADPSAQASNQQVYQYSPYQATVPAPNPNMIPLQSMQILQQQPPQVVTNASGQQFMCYCIYMPVSQGMMAPQQQQMPFVSPVPVMQSTLVPQEQQTLNVPPSMAPQ